MVSASAKIADHSVARRSVVASGLARFSALPLRSVVRSAAPTLVPTVSPLTTPFTSPTITISDSTTIPTKTSSNEAGPNDYESMGQANPETQ